ncbi:probable E3 ubiquitin-protein ligase MGRN1 [Anthonomus grandis grandis]|uniref:probable E3 ubiquitin-protein ligase MGRN1 n=1 Tax=Anthonomus grandis grandis TaxID=2921223 RepID=UPI002165ED3D|nr:probable E3 ubiquitin-protein ligase MGRN1 [Anthonomus grandis grandis]
MGALLSTRQRNGVEEVDVVTNHAYKYPPRSGNYFGSHFIMGGERFDTPQPESYLFGENSDLNFLGSRPTPFPYPPPQPNEPTKTLKCLVNIRKESLRFVRASSEINKLENGKGDSADVELGTNSSFNIEFTFDCDVRCAITVHYFCTEEITASGVLYTPKDPSLSSETFRYKKGANQQFCQPTHLFNPAKFSEEDLQYDVDKEIIPMVIQCTVDEGPEDLRQSHATIATVEKIADGIYLLKALKQKLWVDGLCYLLQEIYGIENKNSDKATSDEETEDNGSECVICMCDVRDTLILPCKHLCLCNSCADSLRYQANNCPICRAPFRALLQIRALQKSASTGLAPISQPDASCENIPPGYEAVSLIEALNGPCQPRQPPSAVPDLVESPENEHAIQAALVLNRQSPNKIRSQPSTPEYGGKSVVTVLTNRSDEDGTKETQHCPLLKDQREVIVRSRQQRQKDSVKMVNERDKDEHIDEDSEAEKLSPLLLKKRESVSRSGNLALHMDDVIDHIDDHEDDLEIKSEKKGGNGKEKDGKYERGDDSDYYTPDEPSAPSTNTLYESQSLGNPTSSIESTPHKVPGTPISVASVKSSADSYASGGSTKQLLAVTTSRGGDSDGAVQV